MKEPLSPYRLTGIAAPMAVWALHLVAVYSLQGVTCAEGLDHVRFAGMEALAWWLCGMTLVTLAALAWLGLRAWRGWRDAPPGSDVPARAARRRFAAAVTGALSLMAIVAVCFTTIPVLLLPGCA
ncbi:hypothetical protein [Luteimonas sp. A649]